MKLPSGLLGKLPLPGRDDIGGNSIEAGVVLPLSVFWKSEPLLVVGFTSIFSLAIIQSVNN
jgi:hypothetical protein